MEVFNDKYPWKQKLCELYFAHEFVIPYIIYNSNMKMKGVKYKFYVYANK